MYYNKLLTHKVSLCCHFSRSIEYDRFAIKLCRTQNKGIRIGRQAHNVIFQPTHVPGSEICANIVKLSDVKNQKVLLLFA